MKNLSMQTVIFGNRCYFLKLMNKNRFQFVLIMMFLFTSFANSAVSNSFKKVLEIKGLGHLNAEDMDKVEDLLWGMNKASKESCQEKADAFDSVSVYFKNQNFVPEYIAPISLSGRLVLVIGKTFPVYTEDFPMGFDISDIRSGIYLVQKTSMGGISKMIYQDRIIDFHIATWKTLPR